MLEQQIDNAIQKLLESEDTSPCEELIRTQGIKSPAIAQAAFEADILRPTILYQDAAPEIRDQLIDFLENAAEDVPHLKINNYLTALAMIGDDTVAACFQKWEENPKPWRKLLFVGPLDYALEGGWCIEDGRRKPLIFEECYALEKSEDAAPEENLYGGASSEKCPHCGLKYIDMLVLDGRDERLSFLGIDGKIKVRYCPDCLPWTDAIFCRYTVDGESTVIIHEGGNTSSEEYDEEDEEFFDERTPFVLSKKMVPKSYCDEFERCAVGGRPAYIDDADYTICPECGKRMMHLAQLGINLADCGTHYIQICRDCQLVTARYQQT